MIVIIFIIIIPATRRLPPVTHHPTSATRHPGRSPAALIFPERAFYVLWLSSCRQSYPQFPQSPLGPPGTMTSLLAHAHKKRKRNGCIFRVSQLTYAGLNSRIVESERNKCKNIKKCMYARWMCSAFWGASARNQHLLKHEPDDSELCRLTGKCFEETLRGGNDVKNLEIF